MSADLSREAEERAARRIGRKLSTGYCTEQVMAGGFQACVSGDEMDSTTFIRCLHDHENRTQARLCARRIKRLWCEFNAARGFDK